MMGQYKRWYTGQDILNRGVKDFELLKAVKSGTLTPHHKTTGDKIIDADILPRKKRSVGEIERFIRVEDRRQKTISESQLIPSGRGRSYNHRSLTNEEIKERAMAEFKNQQGVIVAPSDCIPLSFSSINVGMIIDYIYQGDEARAFLKKLGLYIEISKGNTFSRNSQKTGELGTSSMPEPAIDPPQKNKQRSRSSDLRDKAIIRANEYIDQQKTKESNPTLHKAAIIIDKEIVKGKFQVRTIKGWIRDYFSPESRLPGRIKKEERK